MGSEAEVRELLGERAVDARREPLAQLVDAAAGERGGGGGEVGRRRRADGEGLLLLLLLPGLGRRARVKKLLSEPYGSHRIRNQRP